MENLNKKFSKIVADAQSVKLTDAERTAMLSHINAFMAANPIDSTNSAKTGNGIPSPFSVITWYERFDFHTVLIKKEQLLAGLAFMLIFLVGSTSALAENTLPGDPLYAVKINLNEELQSLLATSAQAKAEVETRRATTRLEEAEKLAAKGALTPAIQDKLAQNFNQHMVTVQKNVAELKAEGDFNTALAVNSDLESSLFSHHVVLANLSQETSSASSATLAKVASVVQTSLSATIIDREAAEKKVATTTANNAKTKIAAGKALAIATKTLIDAREYMTANATNTAVAPVAADSTANAKAFAAITTQTDTAVLTPQAQAEANLNAAADCITKGNEKLAAGAYGEAITFFQKANRLGQKVTLLATLENDTAINPNGILKLTVADVSDVLISENDSSDKINADANKAKTTTGIKPDPKDSTPTTLPAWSATTTVATSTSATTTSTATTTIESKESDNDTNSSETSSRFKFLENLKHTF